MSNIIPRRGGNRYCQYWGEAVNGGVVLELRGQLTEEGYWGRRLTEARGGIGG